MKHAHVVGRFLGVIADTNNDDDTDPDQIPLTGTVTLTPQVAAILDTSTTPPATILPTPIVCTLDADGDLSHNGRKGVTVIASSDPDTNPTNWTYSAAFNLALNKNKIGYNSFAIELPPDVTTDLTLVARVPQSNGVGVTRGVGVQAIKAGDGELVFELTDRTVQQIPLEGVVVSSVNGQSGIATVGDVRAEDLAVPDSEVRVVLDEVYADKPTQDTLVTEVSTLASTVEQRITTEVSELETTISTSSATTLTNAQEYADQKVTAEAQRSDTAYAPANVLTNAVTSVNGQKGAVSVPVSDDATVTALAKNSSSQLRTEIKTIATTELATPLAAKLDKTEAANTYATNASVTTNLESRVNPLVDNRLASDTTVVTAARDAAVTAVEAEMLGRDLVEGGVTVEPTIAFSVVDEDGRRTWLEADSAGKPTAHSTNLLVPAIAPIVQQSIGFEDQLTAMSGLSFAVVDEDNKRTWLEATAAGGPSDHAAQHIRGILADDLAGRVPEAVPTTTGVVRTVKGASTWKLVHELQSNGVTKTLHTATRISGLFVSGDRVFFTAEDQGGNAANLTMLVTDTAAQPVSPRRFLAAWGDSMTAGGHGGGRNWPSMTAALVDIPWYNGGISAQTSTEIALRQGGITPAVTVEGGAIPADTTAVNVTLADPTSSWHSTFAFSYKGYLSGVLGTLAKAANSSTAWTFTRDVAGAAVTHPAGGRFTSSIAPAYRDAIVTIWVGRNNPNLEINTRDVAAMVAHLTPYTKKYLVFPISTSSGETKGSDVYNRTMAVNAALAETYGDRFLDIRRWMIDHGLAAAGITPTAEDTTAINNDTIPPSLLADTLHYNAAGYTALAGYIATVLQEKGWA